MKGNFDSIVGSATPVLVDFSAEWCGPCKIQSPILSELARELSGKIKVIKIDVDRNNIIAARYQIRSVPTLALFKNGNILWRQSGLMDKNSIKNIVSGFI
jgi:thioredoxin 1